MISSETRYIEMVDISRMKKEKKKQRKKRNKNSIGITRR